jgi:hypothetical protein
MGNEQHQGQHSDEKNPSQKDPQHDKDNQQRQGGTRQDSQRRPGQPESNPNQDQQKDKKTA